MPNQAEANLSALIASTKDLIWSVDLEFRLITFNKSLKEYFRTSFGKQIQKGTTPEQCLSPEKSVFWLGLYRRAIKEGPFHFEYLLSDGRNLDLALNPIVTDGQVTGISVFGKDVTEYKQSEYALREVEKKYQAIFEGALEGLYQTTPDGKSLTANPAFAKMLGYDSAEEVVAAIQDTAHDAWAIPNERAKFMRLLDQQGVVRNYECQFKRKDGSAIWVSVNCRKVYGTDGEPVYIEGFIQDICERRQSEMQLRDSEERYRTVFQTSADGITVSQMSDGRYIDVNKAFLDLIGATREEIIGHTSLELHVWADPKARNKVVAALKKRLGFRHMEIEYVRKDGQTVWVLMSASSIEIRGVACILAVVRDITEAKAAESRLATTNDALKLSEERYRVAFQTSIDAININRLTDGLYVDVNQAFLDIMGYTRDEVLGKSSINLEVWANPRDRQTMIHMISQHANCRGLEVQFKKKNGDVFWGQMSASEMELDGVRCILSVTRDISTAKAAENEIRNLAFYDPLTGLPNRRLLLERLRQGLAAGPRSGRLKALLLVDLDNFKTLNDTLGHQAGDLLLQEIARRVAVCVHENDTVCRSGGDEFIVILEELSEVAEEAATQAKDFGEKILALIREPYRIDSRESLPTSSIGITVFGDRPGTTDGILQQADIALYQAKAAGRNTIRFFSPALQATINARATLEEELRTAIKKRQLQLYYQPQIDHGSLTGAEALVRWNHSKRGIVPPNDFIPLAEETGLIIALGDWVLDAACRQIAAWEDSEQMAGLILAVNISAAQFRQPDFVEKVLATLKRTGANPEKLKFELTESMLVENLEDIINKMTELKSRGLSFSLDDFGTGYSSLAYLKRLPLDQMKIDRMFVHDMLADSTSGSIAQAILAMGNAMGLAIIAEGVETEEQRDFLANLGCHFYQGYLFSRPLPVQKFESFSESFTDRVAVQMPQ